MSIPYFSGNFTSFTSITLNSIYSSTPAFSAFSLAIFTASGSISDAIILSFLFFSIFPSACSLASFQYFSSTAGHFSLAKLLSNPGALLIPIKAPSIGIVPEPHIGSIRSLSSLQKLN